MIKTHLYLMGFVSLATLASCASAPEKIKPIANAGPCTAEDRVKLAALYKEQRQTATADAVGVAVISIPIGSLGGGDKEPELAVLLGRCGRPPT